MTERLNLDRHKAIGEELCLMHARLVKMSVEIGIAYPVDAKPHKNVQRLERSLDDLRDSLDSEVFREHGAEAHPGIYYPAARLRTSQRID